MKRFQATGMLAAKSRFLNGKAVRNDMPYEVKHNCENRIHHAA